MPVLQKGQVCAAGAHDQADRDARDHAPYKWVHPSEER